MKTKHTAKSYIIIYGYFISIIMIMLMMFTVTRWYHFKDNDYYSITENEVTAPYENISNPEPNKKYFYIFIEIF